MPMIIYWAIRIIIGWLIFVVALKLLLFLSFTIGGIIHIFRREEHSSWIG